MARKVEPTPILDGEDEERFIKRLNEPSSPEKIKDFKKAKEIFKQIKVID